MKSAHILSLAIAATALGSSSWAADAVQHPGHHPEAAAAAARAKPVLGKSTTDMARMEMQTKAMHQMHDKMMAAKTPDERNALMAEHMKTMEQGMTMMNATPGDSAGGMGGKGAMMMGDMAAHQQKMEKQMEMMTAMMQMMMDRLPAAPAK